MKQCNVCNEDKQLSEFEEFKMRGKTYIRNLCKPCRLAKNKVQNRESYLANRTERIERNKEWRKENPVKVKAYRRRSSWKHRGINPDRADELLAEWDGLCNICKDPTDNPCVDHCHTTLQVRAILCSKCNSGIAFLKEDYDTILRAAEYVKRFS